MLVFSLPGGEVVAPAQNALFGEDEASSGSQRYTVLGSGEGCCAWVDLWGWWTRTYVHEMNR